MIQSHTLCQLFTAEMASDYEQSTLDNTALAFRHFVAAVGDKQIDQVDPTDGQRFKARCLEEYCSKNSINMWLRAIRRVFNWAVEDKRLLAVNPLNGTRQLRVTRRTVTYYDDGQVSRMIRFSPSLRWRAIILCAWTTGFRIGELLNLTRDNFRGDYIYIEAKRRTGRTWPWEPKTKDIRHVPLNERLAEWVAELGCHYPFLRSQRYYHLLGMDQRGLLKARQRKRPEDNYHRTLVKIQRRAFGRQIGDFHQFRRTYITNLSSLPEQVLMQLSGHRDRRTLTHYTAVRQSMIDEARQIIAEHVKNGCLVSKDSRLKEVV